MALRIPKQHYEPIVIDVSINEWLYQVVTLSPWPGGRVSITLGIRGLTDAEAQVRALQQWELISPIILKGRT